MLKTTDRKAAPLLIFIVPNPDFSSAFFSELMAYHRTATEHGGVICSEKVSPKKHLHVG
jgi:hypothetical protein